MKRNQTGAEVSLSDRYAEYLAHGEAAAMYMAGLADAFEQVGGSKELVHHLRHHAQELNMGTLYVEHGYKEVIK